MNHLSLIVKLYILKIINQKVRVDSETKIQLYAIYRSTFNKVCLLYVLHKKNFFFSIN